MKKELLHALFATLFCCIYATTVAQVRLTPALNQLRLEARFDGNYINHYDNVTEYGLQGKRFALQIGGNIGGGFSYYFLHNIVANPGSMTLFDNTDFLYVNYTTGRWNFRLGKDNLFIGNFEYDAAPIEVLFNSYYWGAINCFQLGASASFGFGEQTSDGEYNQNLALQFSNSPYIYSDYMSGNFGSEYLQGLFSYNLYWRGHFDHYNAMASINLYERERGKFMGNIALGQKLIYDKWDIYIDYSHHNLAIDDWGENFTLISCANYKISKWLNLFGKIGYESNHSKYEISYDEYMAGGKLKDCLSRPETDHLFYGGGVEIVPTFTDDFKVHVFVCQSELRHPDPANTSMTMHEKSINANIGITWYMNVHERILDLYKAYEEKMMR